MCYYSKIKFIYEKSDVDCIIKLKSWGFTACTPCRTSSTARNRQGITSLGITTAICVMEGELRFVWVAEFVGVIEWEGKQSIYRGRMKEKRLWESQLPCMQIDK